ncbi:ComEC/Rec2 family competence protein [Pseudooceanicola sp. C21-150M6]|uniref:ComEC/Rec2 family competence protein n=1 Tax=Pseudooceanicola sp. C21-150M6 TaxID=3434355 RepID=UPI003D7FF6C2
MQDIALMRAGLRAPPTRLVLSQRGHLFPWAPVCLSLGIALFFAMPSEPWPVHLWLAALAGLVLAGIALRMGETVAPLATALSLVCAGFFLAGVRAHNIAAPVLDWRYYGPVEGRVRTIDRSGSDALRLTLDQVRLADVPPDRTPARVRISLHGAWPIPPPEPGARIATTAHLTPPSGPVEPGGFDFQRHAWFAGLGAVGYTRNPVLTLYAPSGREVGISRARHALSERIRDHLAGDAGAFAVAVLTGDRSGLSLTVKQRLRESNLAHLLAISGLHMGLVAGFVFAAVRLVGAAIPAAGLRWPVRSIAAIAALLAGAGYLLLSGGSVATERAYIMTAVALGAVLAGRRAMSLRALAVAGLCVLLIRPESLLSPGFQMSFAATTALVAVFAWQRGRSPRWPRPLRAALTLVISSGVAGLVTAPVGAAHFNMIAEYGLAANLLAVPLMGLIIMPAGVIALCLMPLHLEAIPLAVMGLGLEWVLFVATTVSDLPGSTALIKAPGPAVLPLYALGGLWLILWQGWLRVAGIPVVLLAGLFWHQAPRPEVLISDRGDLVGIVTQSGRALSRDRGAGFTARVWAENDGSALTQQEAAQIWSDLPGRIRHVTGRSAVSAATCTSDEILVLTHAPPAGLPCRSYHPQSLQKTGAVALSFGPDGVSERQARAVSGRRLWNYPDIRRRPGWQLSPDGIPTGRTGGQ